MTDPSPIMTHIQGAKMHKKRKEKKQETKRNLGKKV
jgi:hypothetical protein